MIPWERFPASVAEASALARSEEFDPYQLLGEHYAGVRRWTPAFLATFTFQGVPASASLLRAIDMLRDLDAAFDRAQADRAVILLRSARPGIFSAGFDLKIFAANDLERTQEMVKEGAELALRLMAYPFPTLGKG